MEEESFSFTCLCKLINRHPSLKLFKKDVRLCFFSTPAGSEIQQVNAMYFEYEVDNIVQPIIFDDQPVENPGIQTVMEKGVGSQKLLIIETALDEEFYAGMTMGESRVVSTNGFVTVLPSSTQTAEDTSTNPVLLTIVLEELTDSPTKVSCRCVFNQVCFTPCAL